ncbi:hypothetical protein TrST_g14363 [Triparma strigata]|uniref:Myb-like domain-containing protein n=1 Tax=Triparma strigata TaxID=1606541 RepID=A0A9W7B705_9STRA|nr:hypothetical protein TrST_g14363 [Triparma strigata]
MTDGELKTLVNYTITPASTLGRIYLSLGSEDLLKRSIESLIRLRRALVQDKLRRKSGSERSYNYWEHICANVPECLWSLYDPGVGGIIYATWVQGSCPCNRCASFNELRGESKLHAFIQKVGKTAARGAANLTALEQILRRYPLSNNGKGVAQSLWRLSDDPATMLVVMGKGELTNIHEVDIHKIVLPGLMNIGQHTETVESLSGCEMAKRAFLTGAWMKAKGKGVRMCGPMVDSDGNITEIIDLDRSMCLERDSTFYRAFLEGNELPKKDAEEIIESCKIHEVASTRRLSGVGIVSLPATTLKLRSSGKEEREREEREQKERERKERERKEREERKKEDAVARKDNGFERLDFTDAGGTLRTSYWRKATAGRVLGPYGLPGSSPFPRKAAEEETEPRKTKKKRNSIGFVWTEEENDALLKGVGKYGLDFERIRDDNDKVLADRTPSALKQYLYRKYPAKLKEARAATPRKQGILWTSEEDATLTRGMEVHGKDWEKIISENDVLKRRTPNALEIRYSRFLI